MWLTGFDAPSLHTMYVDKPMRGRGLMQAIARVNRVFRDKPGGLVVDYLGLSQEPKQARAAPGLRSSPPPGSAGPGRSGFGLAHLDDRLHRAELVDRDVAGDDVAVPGILQGRA